MNFFKLIGARRRSGKLPTLEPQRWTTEQRRLAEAGCCIECGAADPATGSYLCTDCQGKMDMAEIRDEIAALRRSLLNKP